MEVKKLRTSCKGRQKEEAKEAGRERTSSFQSTAEISLVLFLFGILTLVIHFVDQVFKNNNSNGCFCNNSNNTMMCKEENINSRKIGEEVTITSIKFLR